MGPRLLASALCVEEELLGKVCECGGRHRADGGCEGWGGLTFTPPRLKLDGVAWAWVPPCTTTTTAKMPPTALAIRRVTRDINTVMSETGMGYFYIPDDTEVMHGWAVVIGPKDTPYEGGAFCFEVRFPDNYPFEPPVFTYLTNDGMTRFNPNLYKNGKVCLSLLNTWQGEPWSGVQSLSSILQCIQTAVLTEEPLRNEPGYSTFTTHADFEPYKRIVFHSVLQTAILRCLAEPPDYLVPVYDGVRAAVMESRERLLTKARSLAGVWDGKTEVMTFFGMCMRYRFGELAQQLEKAVPVVGGGGGGGAGAGAAVAAADCEF